MPNRGPNKLPYTSVEVQELSASFLLIGQDLQNISRDMRDVQMPAFAFSKGKVENVHLEGIQSWLVKVKSQYEEQKRLLFKGRRDAAREHKRTASRAGGATQARKLTLTRKGKRR